MRKFWVYTLWSSRSVLQIEIVKETPQRFYIKWIRTIYGDVKWSPSYVDKDNANLMFDTPEEALRWCETDAELTLGKAQQAFIDKMADIKEAYAKLKQV